MGTWPPTVAISPAVLAPPRFVTRPRHLSILQGLILQATIPKWLDGSGGGRLSNGREKVNEPSDPTRAAERGVGLCALCRHVECVPSARGVTFYLCRLSFIDPRFPKYPTLPVITCSGFQRREES